MKYPKKKLIFLDTETTGLNYANDRIIQISCIKVEDLDYDGRWTHTFKTFDHLLNPSMNISHRAFLIHGISNNDLQNKPSFKDKSNAFLEFIEDYIIVAHNAKFDINFVNNELKLIGYSDIKNSVIDSIDIARRCYPGQSVSLDSLMKRFNIAKRYQHNALEDAIILAKIYALMINKSNSPSILEEVGADESDFSSYRMCDLILE